MVAGALEILMFSEMARLSDDMRKANAIVGGSMQKIESAVGTAKAALGALGIGLGIGYFVSLIKGSIDAQDHLLDLHKTMRITVEDLSGLKLAAKQTGSDLDGTAKSINFLSKNIGANSEDFKKLGITAKDPLEAFKQLSDVFVSIQDPQQRAAVMAKALGKSWESAAPLLAEGGKKIGEIVEVGKRLSGQTKEMAEEADKFNDQMAELNTTLGSATTRALGPLLPGMNDIAAAMREAAKEGGLLLTIWVGLGGAMANLLGMTEAQKTAARLREITDELAAARLRLQSQSTNPKGSNSHFFSFLVPDIKVGEDALAKLRGTITALEAERARLTPSVPGAPPGVDPAAAAEAARRAAAFLDDGKAAKDRLAMLERYRKLDADGWVKNIEEQIAEYERGLAEEAKLTEEFYKRKAELDKADQAAVFAMIDAEQEHAIEAGKAMTEGMTENHKQLGKAADAQKKVWESIESTAHDTFINIHKSGKDVFERLTDTLQNTLLEALWQMTMKPWIVRIQEQVTSSGGGGGGGWIDGIMKAFGLGGGGSGGGVFGGDVEMQATSGGFEDFYGNLIGGSVGLAEGTDYVPRTGLALVHQGERIIPASENNGGSSGGVTIVQNINIDSRSDRSSILQAMNQAKEMAKSEVLDSMNRGGPFAKASGRA